MARQIQYPYAFDEDENLIFIKDVDKAHRYDHKYHCPNCGGEMLPRLGEHNENCFAHAGNQKCSGESYLHKAAKIIIARRFNERNKPFKIGLSSPRSCINIDTCQNKGFQCEMRREYGEFDLMEAYDLPPDIEVDILEPDGETHFTPDVMLRSSSPKRDDIFIEIYYKHKVTKEKVGSGHLIIEIRVRELADLKALDTTECFKESKDIVFYNFKPRKVTPEQLEESIRKRAAENDHDPESWLPYCKLSRETKRRQSNIRRMTLYQSGKTYDEGIFEEEIRTHHPSAMMDITYEADYRLTKYRLLAILAKLDVRARLCDVCDHHVCYEDGLTWCNLGKNGTSRKGTFDPFKGRRCRFFEWPDYSFPGRIDPSTIDPSKYSIWINPDVPLSIYAQPER